MGSVLGALMSLQAPGGSSEDGWEIPSLILLPLFPDYTLASRDEERKPLVLSSRLTISLTPGRMVGILHPFSVHILSNTQSEALIPLQVCRGGQMVSLKM